MRTALELTDATSVHLPGSRRAAKLRTPDEREQAANRASEALRSLPQVEVAHLLVTLRGLLSDGEWVEADSRFASEALLTWDELRALAAGGVVVGSHTRDHAVLHENQPDAEIEAQVMGSRARIEERLGVACRHFCYPHGSPRDVSPAAVRAVRTAGYSCAFMNVGGPVREGMDDALLPRVAMVGSGPEAALAPRVLLSHSKWYAELAPRVGR
jgi:peptidoglycan/xylan/chitin deacetylase (PgdA/CDA1 family)